MEAAASIHQSTPASVASEPASIRDASRTLKVTATFVLSEDGRKASLLSGGNGHAVQELAIEVPANRLHLVSVDAEGTARLKLRPRYQLDGERGVTRVDTPPTYDAPPDLDELFREAARNHQLAEAFYVARRTARSKRQEAERDRRARIAQAFLDDHRQRALVHPAPTEKRCYVSTEQGRVLFDVDEDQLPSCRVPPEAHRRFRADLRERKERNRQTRAIQLSVHEEKKRFIAEWIAAHGTDDQRDRQTAGLLPIQEAIEAIADSCFAAAARLPRYQRDGAVRFQTFLRQLPEYSAVVLGDSEIAVSSCNARAATPEQWAAVEHLRKILPAASIALREHTITLKGERKSPTLKIVGILATCYMSPLHLRREFALQGHTECEDS